MSKQEGNEMKEKLKDILNGKRISILVDSISTHEGISNDILKKTTKQFTTRVLQNLLTKIEKKKFFQIATILFDL